MDNIQEEKPSLWFKIKRFTKECIRVFKITKKPTKEEYKSIVKVSGIGIAIIGIIGFIIRMIWQILS
ncbi:MAG: protein translocase SEC61 complex subunit gamma [Candidatus Woesearchaeota archaeon]|nr:MAG: protein translocase SEC61 complex subunit gamma [Candidatus Woesearchaeota archaeon]